jgi:hypothetical protein
MEAGIRTTIRAARSGSENVPSLRSFLLTRPNFGKDVFGELSERALQEAQAREL